MSQIVLKQKIKTQYETLKITKVVLKECSELLLGYGNIVNKKYNLYRIQ